MVDVLRSSVDRCVEAGEIPHRVDAEDFLQFLALLLHLPSDAKGITRQKRLLAIGLRGFRVPEER